MYREEAIRRVTQLRNDEEPDDLAVSFYGFF
jgi:hypothetical protein